MELLATTLPRNAPLRRVMENVVLRRNSEDLEQMYQPVSKALQTVQADHMLLSDTVNTWLRLVNQFPKDHYRDAYERVIERSTYALGDPVFLAAYTLDRRFQGEGLSAEQLRTAYDFIEVRRGGEGRSHRFPRAFPPPGMFPFPAEKN